jgi:hypothetical protein
MSETDSTHDAIYTSQGTIKVQNNKNAFYGYAGRSNRTKICKIHKTQTPRWKSENGHNQLDLTGNNGLSGSDKMFVLLGEGPVQMFGIGPSEGREWLTTFSCFIVSELVK